MGSELRFSIKIAKIAEASLIRYILSVISSNTPN